MPRQTFVERVDQTLGQGAGFDDEGSPFLYGGFVGDDAAEDGDGITGGQSLVIAPQLMNGALGF